MNISYTRHRIFGVDIIRIVCALFIYMGHSINNYGCIYGSETANSIILAARSPVMSMFFILSGFSISYNYLNSSEWDYRSTRQFYAKRLIQIMPTYLLIHFLWLFLGNDSFLRWLFLTPFELTALQSMYPNIFGFLHNGGTWFISCLLIAYFIYPILRTLFHCLQPKTSYICTVCIIAALIYLPFVGNYYNLGGSIYTNPIFRALEFTLGVLINYCVYFMSRGRKQDRSTLSANVIRAGIAIFVCAVFLYLSLKNVSIGYHDAVISLASFLLYPTIFIILYMSYISRSDYLENNRLLKYFSSLIYYFFVLQLVLWTITDAVFNVIRNIAGIDLRTNSMKILVSFSVCLILSIAICELIDKPVKKLCFSKLSVFSKTE